MVRHDPPAELAALHRSHRARLECWGEFAAGRCTLVEASDTARRAGQTEAEITLAAELFAPIGAVTITSITAAIAGADPTVSPVIQSDPARWRRPAIAAVAAMLAACVALWVVQTPGPSVAHQASAPMVAHELSITGVAEVRGDAAATPSVPAGAALRFLLRPATRHNLSPTVWACAVRDGINIPLAVTQAPSQPGQAVQLTASLPDTVTPGAWELLAFASSETPPASEPCSVAAAAHVSVSRSPFVVR